MDAILTQLNRIKGVGGCILFSSDGLPMASNLREDSDEDQLAASIAGLISNGFRLTKAVQLGKPHHIFLNGDSNGILILAAGPSFLAIITDPGANLALLRLEVRSFAEAIAERLNI